MADRDVAVCLFERAVAEATGARYAVAASSYSEALAAATVAAGAGPGREVVLSPLADGRAAEAAWRAGGEIRWADLRRDWDRLGISPAAAFRATSLRTAAVVASYPWGVVGETDALLDVAWSRRATLIEDAGGSLGATYLDGSKVGSKSQALCCLDLGEAAVVTTGDAGLAETLRQTLGAGPLRDGVYEERSVPLVGRPPAELEARVLATRVGSDGLLAARRLAAFRATEVLSGLDVVETPRFSIDDSAWLAYPVWVRPQTRVVRQLRALGIDARAPWPLHRSPIWAARGASPGGGLAQSELACYTLVLLPVGERGEELERAAGALREAVLPCSKEADPDRAPQAQPRNRAARGVDELQHAGAVAAA